MRTMRRYGLLALLLVSWLLLPLAAIAQHTGGSFGGSRWGSGSSGSSSSSGSSWGRTGGGSSSWSSSGSRTSWGSGSSSGSYGGTSYGGGSGYGSTSGGDAGGGACCIFTVFLIIVIIAVVMSRRNKINGPMAYMPPQGGYPPGGYPMPMNFNDSFSLGALAIAFDSSVRAQVQAEIDQIARQVDMSSDAGLAAAARMLAQMLTKYLDHALMTHQALGENLSMQQAQQQFQQAVDTERGRFMVETVRKDAGGLRSAQGPNVRARAEEGAGFVVVTLLVCRRGNLQGFLPASNRMALATDLNILLAGPGALQAMEVVWVPSDANDVMSSAEMAVVFPTLRPIAPDARVGRRACGHCKSVYAAELQRCPSCGAPPT